MATQTNTVKKKAPAKTPVKRKAARQAPIEILTQEKEESFPRIPEQAQIEVCPKKKILFV